MKGKPRRILSITLSAVGIMSALVGIANEGRILSDPLSSMKTAERPDAVTIKGQIIYVSRRDYLIEWSWFYIFIGTIVVGLIFERGYRKR